MSYYYYYSLQFLVPTWARAIQLTGSHFIKEIPPVHVELWMVTYIYDIQFFLGYPFGTVS